MLFRNVLIIDDDEDELEIFEIALKKVSDLISCTVSSDASGILQQLNNGQVKTDLIFLDLNMPVLSGQQFLIKIKKYDLLKNIPVIIFSTSSDEDMILLTKQSGAHDFITKPDKFYELVLVLGSVLLS